MKHILTTILLIISFTSFAQNRGTIKVQGSSNTFDSTQVNEKLAEKLNISDTADMLSPYLQKSDAPVRIKSIYTMGNSITHFGTYQDHLSGLLGDSWSIANLGISGNTTADMYNRYYQVTDGNPEYVIILGGINDVVQSLSKTSIKQNLQAMYTKAHDKGIIVVASTIMPFGGNVNWSAAKQDSLEEINKWILDTAINIDYKIDAYSFLGNPANVSHLNPIYSSIDSLHPNSAGLNTFADSIYAKVPFASTAVPKIYISGDTKLGQNLDATSSPTFEDIKVASVSAMGYGDSSRIRVGNGSKYTDSYTNSQGTYFIKPSVGNVAVDATTFYLFCPTNVTRSIQIFRNNVISGGMTTRNGGGLSLWGGTSLAYQLNLGTTGNIGIGTAITNPTEKLEVDGNIKAIQFKLSSLNTAPSSPTDTGTLGEIRVTATGIYICIATNSWIKCVGSTF